MRRLSGFSLMEMMVVLLIVSIVAAASAPMINRKLMTSAANTSPFVWAGNNNDIAYNLKNANSSTIIGAFKPNPSANETKPRLYVKTNGTSNPQIALDNTSGDPLKVMWGNKTLSMSTVDLKNNTIPSNSVIIGNKASAKNDSVVVIGHAATTVDGNGGIVTNAVAIGATAEALTESAVAMGFNAKAHGKQAIAIGNGAQSTGNNGVIVGNGSSGSGTVFGGSSTAKDNGLAVGGATHASKYSTAIGALAQAGDKDDDTTDFHALAVGASTQAMAKNAVAIGDNVQSLAATTIGIGSGTTIKGVNTIAIGHGIEEVSAASTSAVALGNGTKVGANALALGANSKASGDNAITLGESAEAEYKNSIAIGNGVKTSEPNEIKIGGPDSKITIEGQLNLANVNLRVKTLVVDEEAILNLYRGGTLVRVYDGYGANITRLCWLFSEDFKGDDDNFREFLDQKGNSTCYYSGDDEYNNTKISAEGRQTADFFKKHVYNSSNSLYATSQFRTTIKKSSDRRLKNVGEKFKGGLEELKKLDLYHYTFKNDKDKTPEVGVMAQDLQKVFPDAVTTENDGYLSIRWDEMFYALINAVKELDNKIDTVVKEINDRIDLLVKQQKKIDELETKVDKLEKRLEALEKKLK